MISNLSRRPPARAAQRGVTLLGLVVWAILIGFFAYIAVRALPTVNEYFTIQSAVAKIAASAPTTVGDARVAFDRQKQIEYSITSIAGKDLEVTKENDRVVIAFAYEKEIPIVGPVYLLLKYQGRSK